MTLTIEREPTFEAAVRAGLNLFLGAGFSVLAASKDGKLPLGDDLKNELCDVFKSPHLVPLPLPRVYDVLFRQRPDELASYLKARFTVEHFDNRYLAITKIALRSIITTNIDDLVNKIFMTCPPRYLNDIILGGAAFKADDAVDYIPLHGSVVHEEANYTFGSLDLATAFARDPDRFHFLTERLQRHPTLFWGYSLQDAGGLQALDKRTIGGREHQSKWIQLRAPSDADRAYFSALGFSILEGTTDELLDYFEVLLPSTHRVKVFGPRLHRYERVPQIAEVISIDI